MSYTVQMYDNGRILIPAPIRKSWNLKPGQELVLKEENGIATLSTKKDVINTLKAELKASLPDEVSLVGQLIEDRRLAASQE